MDSVFCRNTPPTKVPAAPVSYEPPVILSRTTLTNADVLRQQKLRLTQLLCCLLGFVSLHAHRDSPSNKTFFYSGWPRSKGEFRVDFLLNPQCTRR